MFTEQDDKSVIVFSIVTGFRSFKFNAKTLFIIVANKWYLNNKMKKFNIDSLDKCLISNIFEDTEDHPNVIFVFSKFTILLVHETILFQSSVIRNKNFPEREGPAKVFGVTLLKKFPNQSGLRSGRGYTLENRWS